MVFTGTYPEYSVEDNRKAVTANLILNIGPESAKYATLSKLDT